ncbi:MAG: carbohydrate kinase, YjeF related protein [Bacteroidota bacterium]|nr:carbohydrate kinase, YjeF related protein [Bacteroidota bacterium]
MKILTAEQIKQLDKYTIENEPVSSIDLMERAANKFFTAVSRHIGKHRPVYIFCGMGNNGGDGLAVARMLIKDGYHYVHPYIVRHSPNGSADFEMNHERLKFLGPVHFIETPGHFPKIEKDAVIIDAVFGSGLSRPVDGISAEVIDLMNKSGKEIYSVDIPSGLFCDKLNSESDVIIHSTCTYTFHAPKLTFLFPVNERYIPAFEVLDIGLNNDFAQTIESPYQYIEPKLIQTLIKKRSKFSHKGTYGHAAICAGSYGKMGAAVLSVQAALRSGAGLVTAYIPKAGYDIMQTSCPEAMVMVGENDQIITQPQDFSKCSALGVGPGLGSDTATIDFIEKLLKTTRIPLLLDADALNIISGKKYLQELLPQGTVLTPHPGEFKSLAGAWTNDMQKLEKQIQFSDRHKVVTVVKGAHTSVATPGGKVYFNSTGNPGMAKGGSGDVLTGVITALLAQGYTPDIAAIIGVYVHGLAGDEAALNVGLTGMTTRDIIHCLPKAFGQFE